jgi:hypothetical protein
MYVYKNRAEINSNISTIKYRYLGYGNHDKQPNHKKNIVPVLSFCLLDPDPINCNYESGSDDPAVFIKDLKEL